MAVPQIPMAMNDTGMSPQPPSQPLYQKEPGMALFTMLCIILLISWRWSVNKLVSRAVSYMLDTVPKKFRAWTYLLDGPGLIQQGFDRSNGAPYEIVAPDVRYVFVSSKEQVMELDRAPDTTLSLQAASKQMLQPIYTMHGFNWFDRRGTEGVGFVRALRVRHSPVYPTIVKLVVMSNAISFFGKELGTNEKFLISALDYVEETLMCAEIVKLLPKKLAPLIARRLTCQKAIYDALIPIATERCEERERAKLGHPVPKHWIMETAPRQKPWTPKRIVHELIAIWFGSVHALSTTITFAIQDLCLHPEYAKPLRDEAERMYAEFEKTGQGLPLLDSFLKESARLTPVESMSMRRAATQPFTFADGTKLAVGDWACTPVRAIMQSAEYYPSPLEFNGFRFARPDNLPSTGAPGQNFNFVQPEPSKLVDVSQAWHVWGMGRMACPGRYYAVAVMKVIMSQIIMNYNCHLVDPDASRWFTWRSTMLPKKDTMVVFTETKH
ncbi:hypothetical protein FHL15_002152 [Xylaria flabelliformis]|uniref:Cytochrome P450 n=1 Tax=Xylaria flabelliformis TaxID=2512241 RepID=A0A553I9F9_9PEZI|nr:hypothetical protein FHL15_002152 [Xylaria flabelliformis]